jgi:hypothetical protein
MEPISIFGLWIAVMVVWGVLLPLQFAAALG